MDGCLNENIRFLLSVKLVVKVPASSPWDILIELCFSSILCCRTLEYSSNGRNDGPITTK